MANNWCNGLTGKMEAAGEPSYAGPMKKYMRDQFDFFGVKTPLRRKLLAGYLKKAGKPEWSDVPSVVFELWNAPQRELQYCALELLQKMERQWPVQSIELFEWLVVHKSWWDTVDGIAANLVGSFFRRYPEELSRVSGYATSENMWLNRTALLFQLRYKKETDFELLCRFILQMKDRDEFFIRKAIGWALREYAKTDSEKVLKFVNDTTLKPLSRKEALKNISN